MNLPVATKTKFETHYVVRQNSKKFGNPPVYYNDKTVLVSSEEELAGKHHHKRTVRKLKDASLYSKENAKITADYINAKPLKAGYNRAHVVPVEVTTITSLKIAD